MSQRLVNEAIWLSQRFQSMSPMARLLLIGLITISDDQGRAIANPVFLKNRIFVFEEHITREDVEQWLAEISDRKLIIIYTDADGDTLAQIVNWWRFQPIRYPKPSRYSPPPNWTDRVSEIDTDRQAFIYLMLDESTGMYKLGRTNNPLKREITLQSEKPTIKLIAKAKRDKRHEKILHKQYKEKRVRGEWFSLNEDDVASIINDFLNWE